MGRAIWRDERTRSILGRCAVSLVALGALGPLVIAGATSVDAVDPDCILGPPDLVAWWPGDGDFRAAVGPDLAGSATFAPAVLGDGIVVGPTSNLGTATFPTLTDGVTVDAWIRPNPTGMFQAVLSKWDFPSEDDGARTFALWLHPDGRLLWTTDEQTLRRPAEVVFDPGPAVDLFDGGFHHVAATWDRTSMAVFVDGVEIGRSPSQGGTLNPAPTTELRLGSKLGKGTPFAFDGVIDEASVARRALTPAEIAALHAAGGGGKCAFAVVEGVPAYDRGAGARVKGANSGAEIFVGPMTSPSATPRSELGYQDFASVGAKTYQLAVGFDAVTNVLTASIATPAASVDYDLDVDPGTGCPSTDWDVLHLLVRDSRTDGAVALQNVVLDGESLGAFGTLDVVGTPGALDWGVFGFDVAQGFSFTADMVVDGFTGNEAIKVELTAGCS